MGKYRHLNEQRGLAWGLAVPLVKPLLLAFTRPDWRGGENIPAMGGAVIALNHVSQVDPLSIAHLLWDYGRLPRFLAKKSLFEKGVVGWWFRNGGHVVVDRAAGAAGLDATIAAVREGKLVIVYVEGSITKDPTGWPMVAKTGAARIALATGAPVIPIGQWGAQDLLPAYSSKPNLRGRTAIHLNVGAPVRLDDLVGRDRDVPAIHEATDRIMTAIVGLVEELRGEKAPVERYNPARHGQASTGRPRPA